MSASDILALLALVVSAVGTAFAFRANRISAQSVKLTEDVAKADSELQFHTIRAEILIQIADSRRQLDRTRIELGTLKAVYDAEPQPVQVLLARYNDDLFIGYLSRIEALIAQLDEYWSKVVAWTSDQPHAEMMATKALLHRTYLGDESACDSAEYCMAEYCMAEYRKRLDDARTYVQGATR